MKKIFKPKSLFKARYAANGGLAAKVAGVESSLKKIKLPEFLPGDTVKVHVRIKEGSKERIQIFEGQVIARQNSGAGRSFTVRKISHGVGVERVFLENSPKLAKVELATPGSVRRAKLYYLRELEGKKAKIARDIGRSEEMVKQAKAERQAREKKAAAAKAESKSE